MQRLGLSKPAFQLSQEECKVRHGCERVLCKPNVSISIRVGQRDGVQYYRTG
jgi:hypothetical protein